MLLVEQKDEIVNEDINTPLQLNIRDKIYIYLVT